jgi:alpha-1,6-mannosyltransferase
VPREVAPAEQPRPDGPDLRLLPRPRLRVADVALFYGERSGGIRTYLEAKAASEVFDHHVITPHDVPSFRMATPNGYRVPIGVGALKDRLRRLAPDVVLLHDPFWAPLGVARAARATGARVVAVHHGSVALDAAGVHAPGVIVRPLLRTWFRHAYRGADAIMSAVPTYEDCGRAEAIPLRFGLHEAFHPRPHLQRGDDVLYVGRLAREKGVLELLETAGRSRDRWPLRFIGSGPLRVQLERRARGLRIADRVSFEPFISDRDELARTYAHAGVVVMPGEHETFGLVGFEAAACGARVVCCETAPSARHVGALAHTFRPGSSTDLAAAIAHARRTEADHAAAWQLVERHSWKAAFAAEHEALRDLLA